MMPTTDLVRSTGVLLLALVLLLTLALTLARLVALVLLLPVLACDQAAATLTRATLTLTGGTDR